MQQQQPDRRFADTTPQQPVHRFPQNNPSAGWQPQGGYQVQPDAYTFRPVQTEEQPAPSKREARREKQREKKARRRRFSIIWNLFALIGMATVLIQAVRYIVVPVLVYLNVITGGTV